MVFSVKEILDIVVMTVVVGYIFSDVFQRFAQPESYLRKGKFDWKGLKFAMMVTAPAVIVHELGHKFVALGFGFEATFNAAYGWLLFGVILKLLNTGFIFFVPAYVSIGAGIGSIITPGVFSLIAFAGPGINLLLWLGAKIALDKKLVGEKYLVFVHLTKQINLFLFIFNMLPIPGFDGFKVYQGIFQTIF